MKREYDEVICDKCNGTGGTECVPGSIASNFCIKCHGAGKLTWIENIVGKQNYTGISGVTGYGGVSGYAGISGLSGCAGVSGVSGYAWVSGSSGYAGVSDFNSEYNLCFDEKEDFESKIIDEILESSTKNSPELLSNQIDQEIMNSYLQDRIQ